MKAAVESGDAKKVAELIRQDPGFDVNMVHDGNGNTLLHYACLDSHRSPVIPLLLAHPDIDVNVKNINRYTPFYWACGGFTSSVREMLKDSRVKVNEPDSVGRTPLRYAACFGHLDIIKLWMVSGREMDLGEPGNYYTDAIGAAKKKDKTEVVALLERFKSDATQTRHAMRVELGVLDELAAELFALVVFVSDGLLQINDMNSTPAPKFFRLTSQLPLELQMVLCYRLVGSSKEIISGKDSEVAFKFLAKSI